MVLSIVSALRTVGASPAMRAYQRIDRYVMAALLPLPTATKERLFSAA
jgi:hypothetical protein